MRRTWGYLSRVVAREKTTWWPQSWKYASKNIKHARWFFCRNPLIVARDLLWWIKYRTTHRFHVIKLNTLHPGWWDTDSRLLHASFALLENYIERERPFHIIDWDTGDENCDNANTIHELYLWWKRYKTLDDASTIEEENERYQVETDNLVRLMKLRMLLWT